MVLKKVLRVVAFTSNSLLDVIRKKKQFLSRFQNYYKPERLKNEHCERENFLYIETGLDIKIWKFYMNFIVYEFFQHRLFKLFPAQSSLIRCVLTARIIVADYHQKCQAVAICLVSSIINLPNCALNEQISKNNTEWVPYNTEQRGQSLHPDWDASPITHLLFNLSMAAYDMAVICPENSINYIIRSRWSTCVKSIIYD